MNKQYKLLKDLPNIKAGEIFAKISVKNNNKQYIGIPTRISIPLEDIENFDDWFELVEKKWRPEIGEKYWYISSILGLGEETRDDREGNDWAEGMFDDQKYGLGNCFKTEELAKDCLELHIKPAFERYWKQQSEHPGVG